MTSFVPSELKIFDDNHYNTSIISHSDLILNPINPINIEQPVEFNSLPSESLKSLSKIFLYGKFQITKKGGDKYTAADALQPSVINCFPSSLIKSIYVTINQTQVACVENLYAFRSYIESVLCFSDIHLPIQESSMFYNPDSVVADSKDRIKNSKTFDAISRLQIFNTQKLLLPHVSLGIKIMFNEKGFVLLENEHQQDAETIVVTTSDLKILELKLIVKQYNLRDSVSLELETLLIKSPAIYNGKAGLIIPIHLAKDTTIFNLPNVYISSMRPSLLISAFLNTNHYIGNSTLDPFGDFSIHNLCSYNYIINEVPLLHEAFTISNADDNECVSNLYSHCLDALSMRGDANINLFTYKRFKKNLFFVITDTSLDHSATTDLLQPLITTSIGVSGKFDKPLTQPLTILLYLLLDTRFIIDSNRIVDKVY